MRYILAWLLLVLTFSGCASPPAVTPYVCEDALGCVRIAPGEPIQIGVLQTLSGGSAPGGTEQVRSIQLAVADRNNSLLDHPLELLVEDDRCSSEGGANAALRIVSNEQVVGILGTNCSSAAVTAGKIMSEKGLVMISSANTAPHLTSVWGERGSDWHAGYFRTAWNDAVMGRAAATFARENLKVDRAAVINAGDAYTKGLTDVFVQVFVDLGGEVVLEATIDEDDPEQLPTLQAIQLSKAELVFFPLSQPNAGARLVTQARAIADLRDVVFIGGESMLSSVFLQDTGTAGEGVYLLGPAGLDLPGNARLRSRYREAFGEDPESFYHSFAYDSTNLLLKAVEQTAVREPDGTLYIGRQALRDTLYAVQDYQGLTGLLTCDSFGDCGAARLNIFQLQAVNEKVEDVRRHVIYTFASVP